MRSRDWIDYLPESEQDLVRRNASYRAMVEDETFVGAWAHVQAAAAPIKDALEDVVRDVVRWLGRAGGLLRSW